MNVPSRIVYRIAGCPSISKPITSTNDSCWLCGCLCNGNGVLVSKAIGESFTDHADVSIPCSKYICVPCVYSLSGKPPNTFRLWTIVYRTDRVMNNGNEMAPKLDCLHFTTKKDLAEVLSILINPPESYWFVAIAITGKKHVLPFTKMNYGTRWMIRVDDDNIHGDRKLFGFIVYICALLYSKGFSKNDILTGNVTPTKLRDKLKLWKDCDRHLHPMRGGSLLKLAILFMKKETVIDVIEQTKRFGPSELGC